MQEFSDDDVLTALGGRSQAPTHLVRAILNDRFPFAETAQVLRSLKRLETKGSVKRVKPYGLSGRIYCWKAT